MEKEAEGNYSADHQVNFVPLDYSLDHRHDPHQLLRPLENSEDNMEMVDYMLNHPPPHPPPPPPPMSLDKLSFADVMQFADFGPKLALNQSRISDEENYFLKLSVLSDRLQEDAPQPPPPPPPPLNRDDRVLYGIGFDEANREEEAEEVLRASENASSVQQSRFLGGDDHQKMGVVEVKNRRKRPRSMKSSEEVESQRMTHIAVERNRRKQMNEHLHVLRSLMPGSYVQRGDQASIIGGAIEFVRELEQLLQCLESQKRRRLFGGEAPRPMTDPTLPLPIQPPAPFFASAPSLPNDVDNMKFLDFDASVGGVGGGGLQEETVKNKSCLADVEVKLLGFDAMIKILSRRRPGQLLKTIEALENLQLNILHTNITTIEQTVLYSFNVKIMGETSFTAEDVANAVQQIFSFINASTV